MRGTIQHQTKEHLLGEAEYRVFYPRVQVDTSPSPAVGLAGAVLLTDTIRTSGLDTALAQALGSWRKPTAAASAASEKNCSAKPSTTTDSSHPQPPTPGAAVDHGSAAIVPDRPVADLDDIEDLVVLHPASSPRVVSCRGGGPRRDQVSSRSGTKISSHVQSRFDRPCSWKYRR